MSTTLNTRIYIRINAVTHMFTYISNRISFSFHLTFPFFVSIKVIFWGLSPFINFICRFTITIVTPKYHKLNFSRSVMLRGGHRPSDKGGGHPDPEIRRGGVKTIVFSVARASDWSKNNGEARASRASPLDPLPVASELPTKSKNSIQVSYHFSNNTKQWKKTEPPWIGLWVAGLLWEFKSNYRVSVKRGVAARAEVGVYLFF